MSEDEEISVEIQANDDLEEQNDCHPDTVEVDIVAGQNRLESEYDDEVDVEVEIPAEVLINVEVAAPDVEVEVEVPLDGPILNAEIVVNNDGVVVDPMAEGGGNVDEKPKNPALCCLVIAIIFGVLLIAGAGGVIYMILAKDSLIQSFSTVAGMTPDQPQSLWLIIIASTGGFTFLCAILVLISCICYTKKKKEAD